MIEYNYKEAVKRLFILVVYSAKNGMLLSETFRVLKDEVNSYPQLTKAERYRIYSVCCDLARIGKHKGWEVRFSLDKTFRRIYRPCKSAWLGVFHRNKNLKLKEMLRDKDNIFFICPKHLNCADDHKDLEGKIYVDKFWRGKVLGADEEYAVLSYIKNHKVRSVQKMIKAPYYLTTRKGCRHCFIPVETATVLKCSAKSISAQFDVDEGWAEDSYYHTRMRAYAYIYNNVFNYFGFRKFI